MQLYYEHKFLNVIFTWLHKLKINVKATQLDTKCVSFIYWTFKHIEIHVDPSNWNYIY
jgi:hypothetical protein